MRVIRIYQEGYYQSGDCIELSPEASQHVALVLRMKAGASLTLFRGDNQEFIARILEIKKKQVLVQIENSQISCRESPLKITLAQGISKGERMEWVMQKAVELGVYKVVPLITEFCAVKLKAERLAKKKQLWQSIAISACEQCGRNTIPVVQDTATITDFLQQNSSELSLVLDPLSDKTYRDYKFENYTSVTLMVGPEGGLSEQEIQLALKSNFKSLSMGPRILRTETAAITALSVLQAWGGDL